MFEQRTADFWIEVLVEEILKLKEPLSILTEEEQEKVDSLEAQILEYSIVDLEETIRIVLNYPEYVKGKEEKLRYLANLLEKKRERGR